MTNIKGFKLANAVLVAAMGLALTGCGSDSTTTTTTTGTETATSSVTIFADELNSNWSFYDCCSDTTPVITTDATDSHGFVAQFTGVYDETTLGFSTGTLDVSGLDSASTLTFDIKVISAEGEITGDTTTGWYVKLESDGGIYDDDDTTGAEAEFTIDDLVIGTWKTVTIDFDELDGLDLTTIDKIMISPAWGSADGVVYNIDNVVFNAAEDSTTDTEAPVITLVGSATISLENGDSYDDAGATVSDNEDTDLTVTVVGDDIDTSVNGTYTITYNVTDSAGNEATEVTRTVTVVDVIDDTTAPVITLLGSSTVSVTNGDTYEDAGATVSDNVDTDLVATVTGSVDTDTNGTYTLTYSASDDAGNVADEVTRTVTVADFVDTTRDATEATYIVTDDGEGWEEFLGDDATFEDVTDDNENYDHVTQFTIGDSAAVVGFGGDSVVDMSDYSSAGTIEFDLKVVTKPTGGTETWYLKTESSDGGVAEVSLFSGSEDHEEVEEGVWQHYVFDLATLSDDYSLDLETINKVMLFPAWGEGSGAVYQLDNVAFYPDGAVIDDTADGTSGGDATTTVADGIDFEGEQLSWTTSDTSKLQFVDNPDTSGDNTSATVALTTTAIDASEWATVGSESITAFTLDETNSTVKMWIYKSSISTVYLKLTKYMGDGWGTSAFEGVDNTLINQWEELTFDFSDSIGLSELQTDIDGFSFHLDSDTARTADTVIYFDNITFSEYEEAEEVSIIGDEVAIMATSGDSSAELAIDGDSSTRWESEWIDDVTLTYNLGSAQDITTVDIDWEAASAADYELLASTDGTNWDSIESLTDLTGARTDSIDVNGNYQYLKIDCTARSTVYGYSIYEITVNN